MVILVKPEHPEKALLPIEVTEYGISNEVKPVQLEKVPSPIEVTESGMVIAVKPRQPRKAYSPIDVTELGITVFLHPTIRVFVAVWMMQLLPLPSLYTLFPLPTTIEVKP